MKRLLKNMVFLFIDCQATSPNPHDSHLLEIGWARSDQLVPGTSHRAGDEVYFVQIPDDAVIPARVTKVTGIRNEDIAGGLSRREVWERMRKITRATARRNRMKRCPTIIHFARFERPFLEALHQEHDPGMEFPFDILCTHEIARRLYPELPRRGIKALAGYFGYRSGENRRSHDHILATACIWDNLCATLARDHTVTTYADLKKWLEQTPVRKFLSRGYPMKDRYRRHLPDTPGVYCMCRSAKDILYIGKARSLKKRVNSYFKKRGHHAEHILEMLTQARRIKIIETGSALEASLLESDQIKQHSPPYNVALRTRERVIMYCDTTFMEFSKKPSQRFRIGPLTSRDPLYRLGLLKPLVSMAGSAINQSIVQEALMRSGSCDPKSAEVDKGVELFIARHLDVLSQVPASYALYRLGRQLWLFRGDTIDVDEGDEPVENALTAWSPEHVARALENVVVRSLYTMRRARLCVLLAESSIGWQEQHGKQSTCHFIVLQGGVVVERGTISRKKQLPVPPGYKKTFLERQQTFDVATVDRMRVLITELRRLVNTGSWVQVRLRPRALLDNDKMERIFTWV
ncbi:GIY-YIG nuclease family protein [candidate division WOR-3 bacterium]|nr:GIY-YIG nuclease family protein [candidate division WOR-3 bacterium]